MEDEPLIYKYQDKQPRIAPDVFIAEGARIAGDVEIGESSGIWYNAVIRGDVNFVRIGKRTNVQDGAVLHVTGHDYPLVIGDDVTIGHLAILHGCTVGSNVLIGMGAIVLDGAVVEDNAIVGSGALVPPGKVIPAGTLAVGSPAKVVRELRPEEIQGLRRSAEGYARLRDGYR